jgi:hypothetical protein
MNIQRINRSDPEKIFVTILNAEGGATPNSTLDPGKVVQYVLGTNATQTAGVAVKLMSAAVNLTAVTTKVAGVVPVGGTISTGAVGVIQVFGYHSAVRASASLASGRMVVAGSINATNIGHLDVSSQSTLCGPEYIGQAVGWTVEDSANATNAKVHISSIV